ncbi:TasA family protein [Pyrococcus abyssi]|uniref:Methyltransferase n=1 Tax=Pyrococcus abyssi (strain GE5 / Orsay) TaxID=272844 RepID=Q9UY83_PYRAB|nr:TasA family protein [Pyrococcus abyssi]CAB50529.1 Hypothetical protein PAB1282 [Pyrococcus abyssi GE5]CCE71086.1 TPA: hypothetical protein PAB1282 [Pyrococcus abyssi GE5]
MKKRILLVVITLLLSISLGYSLGNFTDVAKSKGNTITTGEFDIRISKDGKRFYDETKILDISGLKPGDVSEVTFYVKNYGDIPVSNLTMVIKVRDYEEDFSPAEEQYDLTDEEGELSKCLYVEAIYVNGTNVLSNPTPLYKLANKEIKLYSGSLPEDAMIPVRIIFNLPKNVGNECMTDGCEIVVKVIGTQ